jgi:hypothetical protein
MKFGNPKIKSHNVQMNRKPIKDLKKYALGQKHLCVCVCIDLNAKELGVC